MTDRRDRGLRDRVVIVTGAGGGIARATALAFGVEGSRLVLADIDAVNVEEVATSLKASGSEAEVVLADVTSSEGAASVVDRACDRFGTVDVLANVVGGSRPGQTATELSEADWDAMLRLNLTSAFLMSRFALPHMEAQGRGVIVNVSSGAGLRGMKANPAYCAAKAGVVGLTRSLAIDHAPNGIRINAVAPGAVLTPLMRRNRSQEEIGYIGRQSLLGRVAQPDELADVIVWLASDESSYLVGQTLSVDGGTATAI
jgi:NAD(P)-dependent dehydrogenase (short-subunit alcohol dehydrogenase family)